MHQRIKAVREKLGLSQRAFGEKLGVSRDVISNLEYNRVQPQNKNLLIRHICTQYSVNEEWLLTGKGEMFSEENHLNTRLEEAMCIFKDLEPDFQNYALEQIKKLSELQNKKP